MDGSQLLLFYCAHFCQMSPFNLKKGEKTLDFVDPNFFANFLCCPLFVFCTKLLFTVFCYSGLRMIDLWIRIVDNNIYSTKLRNIYELLAECSLRSNPSRFPITYFIGLSLKNIILRSLKYVVSGTHFRARRARGAKREFFSCINFIC